MNLTESKQISPDETTFISAVTGPPTATPHGKSDPGCLQKLATVCQHSHITSHLLPLCLLSLTSNVKYFKKVEHVSRINGW